MISSFKMALRSIGSNKMRAALTMLGIIIGVMALVVLVSLVNGATSTVTDEVSSLGSNYVSAYTWSYGDNATSMTVNDLKSWARENDTIESVAAVYYNSGKGKAGSSSHDINIVATMPAYADINGLEIMYGRFLKNTDVDNNSRVCVLSQSAAEEVVGYTDCVGEDFSIDGMRYTIVGVLGTKTSLLYSSYKGYEVYVPYTAFTRQYPQYGSAVTQFYATAYEGMKMSDAEAEVKSFLYDFYGNSDSYYVYSQDVMEDTMGSVTNILKILLGGIASISLIVGGIGIMNIMLVTVTERTREIGIRKAIGANRADILLQFLMEAVVLCMLGCLVGIFLSWCVLRLASTIGADAGLHFTLSGGIVALSAAFCFAIGVIFGLYPANKAAKMKPIDALHYGG
jgi:putative ABC transport system permease protein